jgi:crotonobetainyl-CoA:carnitine CoA-transferase CaiB-like acyl-CoA transferase
LSGIFPSRGYDQWVAVDIENGSDWNVLCGFLDRPDLDVASRTEASAREGELGSALASWIGGCSAHTGMHHLQRAGLAAAVVQDPEDLWRDTQLRARNFVEEIFQDDVGSVTYAGSPQRWSSTPGRAALPPARLGQHTYDVLRRWLHLSDEELGALEARGTIFATE